MDEPSPLVLCMRRSLGRVDRWRWTVERGGIVLAMGEDHPTPAACGLAMATDGVRAMIDCEAQLAATGRR